MTAIYLADILNPMTPSETEFIPNGALAVTEDGKIAYCGRRQNMPSTFEGNKTDFGRLVILPGLIDAHVHLPQYDMTAIESENLLAWLEEQVFPSEARFAKRSTAEDISKRFFEGLKVNGTTAACVYTTVHKGSAEVAFEAASRSGVRVIMGKVMTDIQVPKEHLEDPDESLEQSEQLCRKWHNADRGRIQYSFIPRAAPACSQKLMKGVSRLAKKYAAYIQSHLAESYEDLQWLRESHGSTGYVELYHRCGILAPKTIMAHAIYVTEKQLEILANTNTAIAHCPSSNLFLKSGIMDVRQAIKLGVRVGLGSDVGGGPSLSMFREMAMAGYVSKALWTFRKHLMENLRRIKGEAPSRERRGLAAYRRIMEQFGVNKQTLLIDPPLAFYLATLGGATSLGLENKIGSLRKDKEADFLVVDPYKIDTRRGKEPFKRTERVLSELMYRGDDRVVVKTFVRGREIFSAS